MVVVALAVAAATIAFVVGETTVNLAEEIGYSESHDFHTSMSMGHGSETPETSIPLLVFALIEMLYLAYILTAYIRQLRRRKATSQRTVRPIVLMFVSSAAWLIWIPVLVADVDGFKFLFTKPTILVDATCTLLMLLGDSACYARCCEPMCDQCCARIVLGTSELAHVARDEEEPEQEELLDANDEQADV